MSLVRIFQRQLKNEEKSPVYYPALCLSKAKDDSPPRVSSSIDQKTLSRQKLP